MVATFGRGVEVDPRMPTPCQFLNGGDVNSSIMQVLAQACHVSRDEISIHTDGVAGKGRLARLNAGALQVGQYLIFCSTYGYAVRDLGDEARIGMHRGDEFVHPGDVIHVGVNHHIHACPDQIEIPIGYQNRDFYKDIGFQRQPRHLAIDPDQRGSVICHGATLDDALALDTQQGFHPPFTFH